MDTRSAYHRLALFCLSLALALAGCTRADTSRSLGEVTPTVDTRPAPAPSHTRARPSPTASSTPLVLTIAAEPASIISTPTEFPPATPVTPAQEERIPGVSQNVPTAVITPTEIPAPRLIIPKLSLESDIVKVPARNGEWDLTGLGHHVGWLETTGQKPGDTLAMALVGHVTVTAAEMGPFADLWKLHLDDEVIYRTEDTDYVYRVKYKIDANPGETWRLYVKDSRQLLLVTCTGWDYAAWNYSQRLIVGAEEIAQRPAH